MNSKIKESYFSSYDVYVWGLCIRLHFTRDNYDAVKNSYKIKHCTKSKYDKCPYKSSYEFLSNKFSNASQLRLFLVSAALEDMYNIMDITSNYLDCVSFYNKRKQFLKHLDYNFEKDMLYLKKNYKTLKNILIGTEIPIIVKEVVRKTISYETYVILQSCYNISAIINKRCKEEILWPSFDKKMLKYKSFFTDININHYKAVTMAIYKDAN